MKIKASLLKSIFWFLTFSLSSALGFAQLEFERLAIEELLKEAYVDGVFNEGNVRNVELGFSEHFRMISITENGKLKLYDRSYFMDRVKSKLAQGEYPPPATEMVRIKILRCDIEENVAAVKLNFYQGQKLRYVDLLHLIKSPSGWLITNKVFREIPLKSANKEQE